MRFADQLNLKLNDELLRVDDELLVQRMKYIHLLFDQQFELVHLIQQLMRLLGQ
jgi:hypothetical protein